MNKQKLPEGWKEVELGEIFSFERKSIIKAGENQKEGKYKFFTSSNIQSKFIDKAVFEGEYLIFSTGGSAGVHYCNEKFSTSTDCFVVKVDNKLISKYVYYFLFKNIHVLESGFKGAGLKHISKEYIKKIKIVFPERKEIQQKIVSILEKAEQAKEWRKEGSRLSDGLLKNIFLEMFGNSILNNKKWKILTIKDVCSEIYRYPTFYGFSYVKEGVPVIRINNITKEGIVDKNIANYVFVTKEISNKYPRTMIKVNDILMAVRGDGSTAERIGIVRSEQLMGANMSPNLLRFEADKKIINPLFLYFFLISNAGQKILKNSVTRTAKKTITAENIKKIKVICPPITMQNKFANFFEDFEKIKDYQKQSKGHLDNLFNVLMQKAFKGELYV